MSKIVGLALWVCTDFFVYCFWWILNAIWTGVLTQNWLMVIAGGILGYFFLAILFIGAVVTFILGVLAFKVTGLKELFKKVKK